MYEDYRKISDTGSTSERSDSLECDEPVVPKQRRKSRWLRIVKVLLVTFLSIWGFINLVITAISHVPFLHRTPVVHTGCYCGTSSTEAIAMGCKYDALAAAWLPDHCRDDELTEEFNHSGDGPNGTWLYYRDKAHTMPITEEEIMFLGDTPNARFHMDYSWHEVHCLFYWRKEHRFRFNGKILDPRSDSEEHIMHCGEIWGRKATYGTGTVSGVVFDTNSE